MKKFACLVLSLICLCGLSFGLVGCAETLSSQQEWELGDEITVLNSINGNFPYHDFSYNNIEFVEFTTELVAIHSEEEICEEIPFRYEFEATLKVKGDPSLVGKSFGCQITLSKMNNVSSGGYDVQLADKDGMIEFHPTFFCKEFMHVAGITIKDVAI